LQDYDQAIQLDPEYAEAYHNRGITKLLTYKDQSGCEDLETSAKMGYDKAQEKIPYFCRGLK
jgi:hypothetical protein